MKNAPAGRKAGQTARSARDEAKGGRLFAQLTAQPSPALGPGVAEDIEQDLQRGSAAVGRRIGTAFLSQPFGNTAARLRADDRSAVAMAEALKAVTNSAKAHREVAALLEMAEARIVIALGEVLRDIKGAKPRVRRAA